MNMQAALSSYAKVQYRSDVEVASPHKLIDMLYTGAIDRVTQARGAVQFGNIEMRGKKINSAISILCGLREALDSDQGGDIAGNLDALYVYLINLLTQANRRSDVVLLDEAFALLNQMRDTWRQIAPGGA